MKPAHIPSAWLSVSSFAMSPSTSPMPPCYRSTILASFIACTSALTDNQAYDEASGTAVLFGAPVSVEPLMRRLE